MAPEEKAKELIKKFSSVQQWVGGEGFISAGSNLGKQCAIICVEQIIEVLESKGVYEYSDPMILAHYHEVLEHIKNS